MKTGCSWCEPTNRDPAVSHGICDRHKRELLSQASSAYHGKRPDQVAFSAAVVVWSIILGATVILAGILWHLATSP